MYVLNGNGNRVLESLKRMGFRDYEARAYFTLFLCGEMKAWDIGRLSGVPQPRVYATMESLAEKDLVQVKDGRPKTYRTIPLKRMLGSYLKSRRNDIVYAEKAGRWLNEIADAIGPTVREHKERIRIFEPNYTRG